MNELQLKQIKTGAFAVLALAAIIYVFQYAQSVNQALPSRTFMVTGEADVETPNDIAFFTATVITEGGTDVTKLQEENSAKMNAIDAFLLEKGIEKKDLKTTNYSMTPRYDFPNCRPGTTCPPPSISGYTINQSLEVKVRDVATVGDILAGIIPAGANSVTGVTFITDDDSVARDEAREKAFEDAQTKALGMAKAGGFRLGKLITFYEDSMGGVEPFAAESMSGDAMSAKPAVAPVIEPGTQRDTVRVNMTYEIR
jgi:uncharacterized protein